MVFSSRSAAYILLLQFSIICAVSVGIPKPRGVYVAPTLYFSKSCSISNGILSSFINNGHTLSPRAHVRNTHNFGHIASFIPTVDIVNKVKELLLEHGYVRNVLDIKSDSRLDYNKDAINEAYALARLTHNSFDDKRPLQTPDCCFFRFDGDNEDELSLVSSQLLAKNEVLVSIPADFCHSLASSVSKLFRNFGLLKQKSHGDLLSKYILHIDNLLKLSFGTYFNWKNFQSTHIECGNGEDPCEISEGDSFEKKLFELTSVKRLQLLRVLIIFDTLLSIDSSVSDVLKNHYIKLVSINDNEREILLLGLTLVGDYFIDILDFVLRYLCNRLPCNSKININDRIKTLWLHYLINKDVSHLPALMSDTSIEQIQQHIVRYRVSRRKISISDMFNVVTDPIPTIQDHIEHIAQSHYRREDSFPRKFGYGPLLSDRQIHIEELLCKIESELLSFQENGIEDSPFTISSKDFSHVLNGSQLVDDTVIETKDEDTDFNIILRLFSDYIVGESDVQNSNVIISQIFTGLNSFVTLSLLNRFISTLISHIIRFEQAKPRDNETEFKKRFRRGYLSDRAQGICCKLISLIASEKAVELSDETDNYLMKQAFVVPLIDLCNHGSMTANCRLSATFSGVEKSNPRFDGLIFQLSATRDIKSKDEIKINYGNSDNNIFLLDYGFISSEPDNHDVIMDIEPQSIKEAAESHDIDNMLPLAYPIGLPKEKIEILKDIKLMDIPKGMDIMELYRNPHFEGLPITKYCEFASKFIARENAKKDPLLYYDNNDAPDRTRHRPYIPEPDENVPNEDLDVIDHITIGGDGLPDPRLILLLKVSFCRTVKRLDWIKQQSIEYLSTSINSPLDVKIFKLAATLCYNYINDNYTKTISEDLKSVYDKELCEFALKHKDAKFHEIKKFTSSEVPNAILISHGLRQKIPIYKCAKFYSECAKLHK